MDEIDLKMNSSNHSFELKCLEDSNYLLLYAYMTQQCAIIKASEEDVCGKLFKYCVKIICSFSGSNGFTHSKPKSEKEEKFMLILTKILEILVELIYFGYPQHEIVIEIQQIISIFLYYSEDSWNYSTPNGYQLNLTTATGVLASIGLSNILAKKSTFSFKFRFFFRCLAFTLLKQIMFDQNTNKFKLRMSSSDDFYLNSNESTPSPNYLPLGLLNQQIKQAKINFNAINQLKQYSMFIEHANYTSTMCKTKEFCFPQIFEIIKYLNINLFGEVFYLF